MNSELKERIINIWADSINYDKPISEYDKETILYAILDDLVPDDFKYEFYLEKIKEESNRISNAFIKWYQTHKENISEYEKFYTELEKSFKYQLYEDIYIFFHPIVINNNFITESSELESDPNRRMIANTDFVLNTFAHYMYRYTFDKEDFKKIEINYKEKYISKDELFLKSQQYFLPGKTTSIFDSGNDLNKYYDPKFLLYNKTLI